MARARRKSPILMDARERQKGLLAIGKDLDFGGGLSVAAFGDKIQELEDKLTEYNGLLATADASLNQLVALEKKLRDLHERMLTGVATKFGKDSDEYEQVGGKRKSERKWPKRKPAAAK